MSMIFDHFLSSPAIFSELAKLKKKTPINAKNAKEIGGRWFKKGKNHQKVVYSQNINLK